MFKAGRRIILFGFVKSLSTRSKAVPKRGSAPHEQCLGCRSGHKAGCQFHAVGQAEAAGHARRQNRRK